MLPAELGQLMIYTATTEIPKDVREAIGKAIQMKQAMQDVDRQIATRTQQMAEITVEQNRIRENMKTVAPQTPYYERLMAKLGEQETSIEALQRERAALSTRRDTLRRELEEYLGGLRIG
jgi:chromosome segregation ATPase